MGHHHEHDHTPNGAPLSFAEKASRLIQHWIQHNTEHAASYRQWAEEFRRHQLGEAAQALATAADATARIDQALREAAARIDSEAS